MKRACSNCEWFQPQGGVSRKGSCRAEPPFAESPWPVVEPEEWCRKFAPRGGRAVSNDDRPGAATVEIQDNGLVIVTHHDGEQFELSALEGLSEPDKRILERMVWMMRGD